MTLPNLPPRPSDTPPQQDPTGAQTRAWEASQRVYWDAARVHALVNAQAASVAAINAQGEALRRKTLDEVVLHCAALTPRNDGERDATWAGRVVTRGKALHAEMNKP